jgi:hypothetical protein
MDTISFDFFILSKRLIKPNRLADNPPEKVCHPQLGPLPHQGEEGCGIDVMKNQIRKFRSKKARLSKKSKFCFLDIKKWGEILKKSLF